MVSSSRTCRPKRIVRRAAFSAASISKPAPRNGRAIRSGIAATPPAVISIPLRLADEAISGISPALHESAQLLGHDRFSRAMGVTLPLSLGHLAAAAALVFALALGEVPIASVLAPPGAVPATIWLFGQQHMGYDESVFALSLLLGAATAGTVAAGAVAAKWART